LSYFSEKIDHLIQTPNSVDNMEIARGLEALIATFEDSPHRTYGLRLAAETIIALEKDDVMIDVKGSTDTAESSFMMERLQLAAREYIPNDELLRACSAGNAIAVRALLADPRVTNFTDALFFACKKRQTEIVRLLLADPRTDPSPKQRFTMTNDLLVHVILEGDLDIARLIIAHPQSSPAGLALSAACTIGDANLVRELMHHPRLTPKDGQTREDCIRLARTTQQLLITDRKDIMKILG